jgi:pilus assembly protein Flp/PilA
MLQLVTKLQTRLHREEGATAVEYGLLVALIAAVIIGTVVVLGGQIDSAFTTITNQLGGGV